MATYFDLYELLIEHIFVMQKLNCLDDWNLLLNRSPWMSSYLNCQKSIIDAGVLEVAKRIGLKPMIFDSELVSQHYADHQ